MPNNIKVSDMEQAVELTKDDLVMIAQPNIDPENPEAEVESYSSKKTTIKDLADETVKSIQYTEELQTDSKTITGAINEAAAVGKISKLYSFIGFDRDWSQSGQYSQPDWDDIDTTPEGQKIYQSKGGTYLMPSGNSFGTYTVEGYDDVTFYIKQDDGHTDAAYIVLGNPNATIDLEDSDTYIYSGKNNSLTEYTAFHFENLYGNKKEFQVLYRVDSAPAPTGTATIDLNNGQWVDSGTEVDGHIVYKSTTHSDYGTSLCTINLSGVRSIAVYCKPSSESGYDITYLGELDSNNPSSDYERKFSGIASEYGVVSYAVPDDGNDHFIKILYKKDSSSSSGDDCGYIYFVVNGINEDRGYVYIVPGTVHETSLGEVFNDYNGNHATGMYCHAEGSGTMASGGSSHAEGNGTKALYYYSHAEGLNTKATGHAAHAEGNGTMATRSNCHAEGDYSQANGDYSHAEGEHSYANGTASHAQGSGTKADGYCSHAEGYETQANGSKSHVEGNNSKANGTQSHAEGYSTQANGENSHVEGYYSIASGFNSHAEGYYANASGEASHAEGRYTLATAYTSHAEGYGDSDEKNISSGEGSHAEGYITTASGRGSHAEGCGNYTYGNAVRIIASGNGAHAEGRCTTASGEGAHTEGYYTQASGNFSHAEGGGWGGQYNIASGTASHAEGGGNNAIGPCSHVEGTRNTVYSDSGHADGSGNTIYGHEAHGEGAGTTTTGEQGHTEGAGNTNVADKGHIEGAGNRNTYNASSSHTEGAGNTNYGIQAHVEGSGNTLSGEESHVEGAGNRIHGPKSHGEGGGNVTYGLGSHIEGKHNVAVGYGQHAEGINNVIGVAEEPDYFSYGTTYAENDIVAVNDLYRDNSPYFGTLEPTIPFLFKCVDEPGQIQEKTGVQIVTASEWNSSTTYQAGSVVKVSGIGLYTNPSESTGKHPAIKNNGWNRISTILSPFSSRTPSSKSYYLLDCDDGIYSSKVAIVEANTEVAAMWEPVTTSMGSHIEGLKNISTGDYQHVQGKFNTPDAQKAFIIGNGSVTEGVITRSNAMTVDWSGNMALAGDVTVGTSLNTTATTIGGAINEIVARIPAPPTVDGTYTLSVTVSSGVPTYSWVAASS